MLSDSSSDSDLIGICDLLDECAPSEQSSDALKPFEWALPHPAGAVSSRPANLLRASDLLKDRFIGAWDLVPVPPRDPTLEGSSAACILVRGFRAMSEIQPLMTLAQSQVATGASRLRINQSCDRQIGIRHELRMPWSLRWHFLGSRPSSMLSGALTGRHISSSERIIYVGSFLKAYISMLEAGEHTMSHQLLAAAASQCDQSPEGQICCHRSYTVWVPRAMQLRVGYCSSNTPTAWVKTKPPK